ncbi:nucleotidyltransferase [Campylobacterota bacterium]|nr:nucleotidyltransferase [Campylobacterota bacterium]
MVQTIQTKLLAYTAALDDLSAVVEFLQSPDNHTALETIERGLIERFELSHDMAWRVMHDYAVENDTPVANSDRAATREAFAMQLFDDGYLWMEMIATRAAKPEHYAKLIAERFFPELMKFRNTMKSKI